ncbi:hypothetical protein Dimus_029676, partial [Dionaea muscipula]
TRRGIDPVAVREDEEAAMPIAVIRWRSSRPSLLTLPCAAVHAPAQLSALLEDPPKSLHPRAHRRGSHHLMDAPSPSSSRTRSATAVLPTIIAAATVVESSP